MNKKNIFKITLDIVMAILFITFFNKNLISFKFHMRSGIIFGVFILVHMILNRKWIVNITKRLFDKRINMRVKFSYLLSILLLLSIISILLSGVFIMKAPTYDRKIFYKMIHFGASYLSVGLIGIHVGLYWKFIMNMFKNIFKIKESTKFIKVISNTLLALVLSIGIYTTYKQEYFNKVVNTLTYVATHISPQDLEEPKENGYNKESVSFISLVTTYGSIISVFGIATYYSDSSIKEYNKFRRNKEESEKKIQEA